MLSVPSPSLCARFVGQILSIIDPSMPHRPPIASPPFEGDFVGDPPLDFPPFLAAAAVVPKLFLAPVLVVEFDPVDEVYLSVGDAPVIVELRLAVGIFL